MAEQPAERYEGLARLMGVDTETAEKMRAAWDDLDIDWHCPGRHGVVRGIPASQAGEVQRVIEWHMGHGACRWTKTEYRRRSVEFVHMTKVFPPPRKPWEWCGETVLFADWKAQEDASAAARASFKPGDAVWFEAKGQRKDGIVSHINPKTVAVTVAGEGGWRVSPGLLHRTEA